MASPRIFVSSTCFDLQEIRSQLRQFITDFNYEPVMSEFDDIFYSFDKHVQDSCLDEISKCQLFVLVVGNSYGSLYHHEKHSRGVPDSVTLKEFRKALELKINKHIFINKFVDYDYKNYKKVLQRNIYNYFKENDIPDEKVEQVRQQLKIEFDKTYPFPHDTYRYIFYFLDIIYELQEGNAVISFESFRDIKDGLKKQWASFMHESLSKRQRIDLSVLNSLQTKIDQLEATISKLIDNKKDSGDSILTLDVAGLVRDTNVDSLLKSQDKVNDILMRICQVADVDEYGNLEFRNRFVLKENVSKALIKDWFEHLRVVLQSYKWSKYLPTNVVLLEFPLIKIDRLGQEINYQDLLELFTFYNSISTQDQDTLCNTVVDRINKYVEYAPVQTYANDDLPF